MVVVMVVVVVAVLLLLLWALSGEECMQHRARSPWPTGGGRSTNPLTRRQEEEGERDASWPCACPRVSFTFTFFCTLGKTYDDARRTTTGPVETHRGGRSLVFDVPVGILAPTDFLSTRIREFLVWQLEFPHCTLGRVTLAVIRKSAGAKIPTGN